jgi:hypothetical protein
VPPRQATNGIKQSIEPEPSRQPGNVRRSRSHLNLTTMRAAGAIKDKRQRKGDRVPVVGHGGDDDDDKGDDEINGPTQLRQQGHVGPRPGAYWSSPGGGASPVRAPSPTALPPYASAAELPPPGSPQAATRNNDAAPAPSSPRPPYRDSEVMLEAEPVLSILVNATPVSDPPPTRGRRHKRRTIAILLAVVTIVGAAVAAGVVVGTSKSRAPSGEALSEQVPPPSPPPSVTPGQSGASNGGCPTWEECLRTNGLDAEGCSIECYDNYYDHLTNGTTCEELTALVCHQIDSCTGPCGVCGTYIEAHATCSHGSDCFVGCSSSPPPATQPAPPTPTTAPAGPTPAPTTACIPEAQSALGVCLADANLDGQACVDCYNAFRDRLTGTTTCGELTSLVCGQIDACTGSCGTCGPALAAFETCNYGSACFLGCSYSSGPSPSPSASVPVSVPVPAPAPGAAPATTNPYGSPAAPS